jgi:hypothetical protein
MNLGGVLEEWGFTFSHIIIIKFGSPECKWKRKEEGILELEKQKKGNFMSLLLLHLLLLLHFDTPMKAVSIQSFAVDALVGLRVCFSSPTAAHAACFCVKHSWSSPGPEVS